MKSNIRKFMSMLMVSAMLLSLSTINAFAASTVIDDLPSFERVECDHVEVLEDGGKIYTYVINGVVNKFPVPPDGFDPLTATNEQLSVYGFPTRPVTRDAVAYASWLALVEDYNSTPVPTIDVMDRPMSGTLVTTSNTAARAVSIYSSNWSGYESNLGTSSSTFYTQVQADYTQPTISSISGTSSSNVIGYWVGLGGHNTGSLVQAGTATTGLSDHWAWYEYLSASNLNPAVRITSLEINPGDSIHVYISFQQANDKFNYYIANNTTGKSASGIVEIDADEYFDGSTAEWVIEKAKTNLPKFGSITMSNCQATLNTSNTWKNLNSLSGVKKIILTDSGSSSGTVLCSPGSISSNYKFTVTWKAYN